MLREITLRAFDWLGQNSISTEGFLPIAVLLHSAAVTPHHMPQGPCHVACPPVCGDCNCSKPID